MLQGPTRPLKSSCSDSTSAAEGPRRPLAPASTEYHLQDGKITCQEQAEVDILHQEVDMR